MIDGRVPPNNAWENLAMTDFFKHKAGQYEHDKNRVANVDNIATAILDNVTFHPAMHIIDFGSGTGLLLEKIAPVVGKITAIDVSASMNRQLREKKDRLACELDILEIDLSTTPLDQQFDGIISSMTMHHIDDVGSMFATFYSLLHEGGVIAIADLDREDGSFHTENTGVFHSGFDRQTLSNMAIDAGFSRVALTTASTVHKPHGSYPVFLLTAHK